MHWEVEISGDTVDLHTIAETFSEKEFRISRRDQRYVLEAPELDKLESADSVRERAIEIITALSGLSRVVLGSQTSIIVGAVYSIADDSGRGGTKFPEPAELSIRGYAPTIVVGKADGAQEVSRPADPIAEWISLGISDPAVAKALRLRNKQALDWADLYRIYEVIEDDVGRSVIESSEWVTKSQITQFKHTANSVTATGDQARHGKERTDPPKESMNLSTARSFVDSLLKKWVVSKKKAMLNRPVPPNKQMYLTRCENC